MFPTDDLTKHEKSIQDAYLSIHEANPGGDAPDADVTKMVRQAVYDIRYKARKEDIPLERAYSAYMGHTSMGPKARAMVKAKLFGETVEEEVITEKKVKSTQPEKTETKKDGKSAKLEKYLKNRRTKRADEHDRNLSGKEAPEGKDPVRVTDPESGKTDYTYADPKKIEKIRRKGLKVERGGTGRPGDKKKGKKILKASFSNWRGNTDELAVRRAIEIKEGCPPSDDGSELNGMKKDVKPKSKVKLKGKVSPKSPNVTIMPDSKVDEGKLTSIKATTYGMPSTERKLLIDKERERQGVKPKPTKEEFSDWRSELDEWAFLAPLAGALAKGAAVAKGVGGAGLAKGAAVGGKVATAAAKTGSALKGAAGQGLSKVGSGLTKVGSKLKNVGSGLSKGTAPTVSQSNKTSSALSTVKKKGGPLSTDVKKPKTFKNLRKGLGAVKDFSLAQAGTALQGARKDYHDSHSIKTKNPT